MVGRRSRRSHCICSETLKRPQVWMRMAVFSLVYTIHLCSHGMDWRTYQSVLHHHRSPWKNKKICLRKSPCPSCAARKAWWRSLCFWVIFGWVKLGWSNVLECLQSKKKSQYISEHILAALLTNITVSVLTSSDSIRQDFEGSAFEKDLAPTDSSLTQNRLWVDSVDEVIKERKQGRK